jgi:SAM-dependent methyltransferase
VETDEGGADAVARYFDRRACCAPGAGEVTGGRGRLGAVSRTLLEMLDDAGVVGRSVLDAGSGQGSLAVALSQRGAASVTGVDLSPASVAAARRRCEQAGVAATFTVGDASTAELEPHDVVVLDKVVCCYPDVDALLANTLPATRSVFAVAMPPSRGPAGTLSRLAVGAENGWRRITRDPFRAYVHDELAIARTLQRAGLIRTRVRHRWTWQLAVYERRA